MHAALTSDGTVFDAIHVGAAAATLPQQLCELLAPGGKLVVPVGPPEGGQVRRSQHARTPKVTDAALRYKKWRTHPGSTHAAEQALYQLHGGVAGARG